METVEFFELMVFAGAIILFIGIVGLYVPYHPIHLIFIGLLMFFGGYYYAGAEREREKIMKQRQEQNP